MTIKNIMNGFSIFQSTMIKNIPINIPNIARIGRNNNIAINII